MAYHHHPPSASSTSSTSSSPLYTHSHASYPPPSHPLYSQDAPSSFTDLDLHYPIQPITPAHVESMTPTTSSTSVSHHRHSLSYPVDPSYPGTREPAAADWMMPSGSATSAIGHSSLTSWDHHQHQRSASTHHTIDPMVHIVDHSPQQPDELQLQYAPATYGDDFSAFVAPVDYTSKASALNTGRKLQPYVFPRASLNEQQDQIPPTEDTSASSHYNKTAMGSFAGGPGTTFDQHGYALPSTPSLSPSVSALYYPPPTSTASTIPFGSRPSLSCQPPLFPPLSADRNHYTIPPPQDRKSHMTHSARSSISSIGSSTTLASPTCQHSVPAPSLSPEERVHVLEPAFVPVPEPTKSISRRESAVVRDGSSSPAATVVASGSPAAAATKPQPSSDPAEGLAEDELNLIADGLGSKDGGKASIFECPGCDLTFTRLSALKQHMLSHTGEKPHACAHCGRRFSLASNLRRHTSTKACKVLKFQEVKDTIASTGPTASTIPRPRTDAIVSPTPTPLVAAPAPVPAPNPITSSPITASPKKESKKRKAPTEKQPTQRRKRHANMEARWLPRTLALFKNAHLLTSTPPFQFCIYRAQPKTVLVDPTSSDDDDEPFTRPTLPLNPVRPTLTSRSSIRSTRSSSSSSGSSADGNLSDSMEDDGEERNSYEFAPEYPYHPASWHGRLPGPGLLSGDELVKNSSVARRWMSFKR